MILGLILVLAAPGSETEAASSRVTRPASNHAASSATPAPSGFRMARVDFAGLVYDPTPNPRYVPPPRAYQLGAAQKTASVVVNYNPSSCSGTTTPWTTDAQAAFQMAADIWASILNGTQTIEIDACWVSSLPSNILGQTKATAIYTDFTGAPQANTWYVAALANQLAGMDLNGGTSEITIAFNSNFNWFLGTGAQDTDDQPNFVSVVLHEIGHGLGITGRMKVDDGVNNGTTNLTECNGTAGVGCWGSASAYPGIYDRFTENGSGTPLLNYANNSTALGNQLTSNSVFFNGTTANILNGFTPPELYAPATWNPGSSYSHLAESYNNTVNALMTFSLSAGEVEHNPGPVALGILQDLGWDLRNLNQVWVDKSNSTGIETGSPGNPFNTVFEGVSAVYPGGNVYIESGSYNESVALVRSMVLQGLNGTVVIGQ
jgi:hypothetical protein